MTQGLKHLPCNTKTQVRILSAQRKPVWWQMAYTHSNYKEETEEPRDPSSVSLAKKMCSTFSEEFCLRKSVESNRRRHQMLTLGLCLSTHLHTDLTCICTLTHVTHIHYPQSISNSKVFCILEVAHSTKVLLTTDCIFCNNWSYT